MQLGSQILLAEQELLLRDLRRDDAADWYAYLRIPAVVQHTSWDLSCMEDLLPQFEHYESTLPESALRLAIVSAADQTLIGTIGLHTVSPVNRSAELAYDLAPAFWGRGIARAAATALLEWAFDVRELNRIQATTLESNIASQRVLQKLEFQREGCLRAYRMVRGKPGNFWMYARLHPQLRTPEGG
ncbi:MAG: GNAT family N-acetyltransferase [Burkholderiales bacterium]|nr:GNAT family N-acetyltransferase [Burkholderiales bacterium]